MHSLFFNSILPKKITKGNQECIFIDVKKIKEVFPFLLFESWSFFGSFLQSKKEKKLVFFYFVKKEKKQKKKRNKVKKDKK